MQGGNRLCELTSGERRRERREAMAAEAEARMEAECTFRPRLTAWPRTTAGPGQENRDPAVRTALQLQAFLTPKPVLPDHANTLCSKLQPMPPLHCARMT